MKPKLRTSFLLIGSLFVFTTIERAISLFNSNTELKVPEQKEAIKAGFFLTLLKDKPLNFINDEFIPNRKLYFFYKNSDSNYKSHYLNWYLDEKLIKTQACLKKEICLGTVKYQKLNKGFLSVDIFNGKKFIASKSIEIIDPEISSFLE